MAGNIIIVVLNVRPFLHSSLGVLLSISTWRHISLVLGYPRSAILLALHCTVPGPALSTVHQGTCRLHTPGPSTFYIAMDTRHLLLSATQVAAISRHLVGFHVCAMARAAHRTLQ